jgi:alpha-beta hydrolase superfamily lysophospholipase
VVAPTLVSVGELDPVTPVAAAEEIVAALPEGIGRLEIIEGAGHWAWKDAPDRFWPMVREFVDSATGVSRDASFSADPEGLTRGDGGKGPVRSYG